MQQSVRPRLRAAERPSRQQRRGAVAACLLAVAHSHSQARSAPSYARSWCGARASRTAGRIGLLVAIAVRRTTGHADAGGGATEPATQRAVRGPFTAPPQPATCCYLLGCDRVSRANDFRAFHSLGPVITSFHSSTSSQSTRPLALRSKTSQPAAGGYRPKHSWGPAKSVSSRSQSRSVRHDTASSALRGPVLGPNHHDACSARPDSSPAAAQQCNERVNVAEVRVQPITVNVPVLRRTTRIRLQPRPVVRQI